MATEAAATIPTARAVPLSAHSASQSMRDMPAVATSSATMAHTKPTAHTTRALGLMPLLFLPLQIQQNFQIVHNGPHEGGDLLLFTAGEETDVRVKLCVGTAHQDLSIRPFLRLQYLFQPGCQGVEGPGGAGRALG